MRDTSDASKAIWGTKKVGLLCVQMRSLDFRALTLSTKVRLIPNFPNLAPFRPFLFLAIRSSVFMRYDGDGIEGKMMIRKQDGVSKQCVVDRGSAPSAVEHALSCAHVSHVKGRVGVLSEYFRSRH